MDTMSCLIHICTVCVSQGNEHISHLKHLPFLSDETAKILSSKNVKYMLLFILVAPLYSRTEDLLLLANCTFEPPDQPSPFLF